MLLQLQVTVLLAPAYLLGSDALRCRVCNQAMSLSDCTKSTQCAADEKCYMDQVVTQQRSIIFNGGCRASDACAALSGGHVVGKRYQSTNLVCAKCCNVNPTSGLECNAKLCSLPRGTAASQQCYFCDSTKAGGQGDVDSPSQCRSLRSCQTDEVCGTEMYALARNTTYRFTCFNRRFIQLEWKRKMAARFFFYADHVAEVVLLGTSLDPVNIIELSLTARCTILTQLALKDLERCRQGHSAVNAAGMCGNRKRAGATLCTACCGDSLCNSGSCFDVLDRLYNLWKAGVLNFGTLKANGTIPSPSTIPSTHSG